MECFAFQNHSLLAKDFSKAKQAENEEIVKEVNDVLICLTNDVNKKKVSNNKNTDKVIKIVVRIPNFNKQLIGKRFIILTPKQMLQRLPIVFPQVKASNTTEKCILYL